MNRFLRWVQFIAMVGLCGGLCIVAVPFLEVFVGIAAAPQLAYNLAPPPYPESQLIGQEKSSAVAIVWQKRSYYTPDSLPEVLAFMEGHMPGFSEIEWETGEAYHNSREDTSAFARHAAEISCSSLYCAEFGEAALSYPSASVTLYPTSEPAGTIIEIWVSWPVP